MSDSIKTVLHNHPFGGVTTSLAGYILSLSDFISPILRFCILVFSTVTAVSLAYVQYNKARRIWNAQKDPSKKNNSNSG